jgi:hypothetical protein
MKQKHANLWEARTSREGSELAAKAGNVRNYLSHDFHDKETIDF